MLTTVPTLVNDVVSSKPAICCRMMSLISVGRTAMVSAPLPPPGDKPSAHLFQFVADATVDNLIANADDDAADDVRVDLERQFDLLASHRFQLLADVIQFGIGEPFRCRH